MPTGVYIRTPLHGERISAGLNRSESRARRGAKIKALWESGHYDEVLKNFHSPVIRAKRVAHVNSKMFREAARLAKIEQWKNPVYRRRTIKMLIKNRSKQVFPFKDSSIEVAVQTFLLNSRVKFLKHKTVTEVEKYHQWDLVLPNSRLLVEINGCYWHGCPKHFPNKSFSKRDGVLDQIRFKARAIGWDVMVLWEHDIKSGVAFDLLGSVILGYQRAA